MPWEKQFNTDEALNKALQVFWAFGYEATSMRDIVDCTGVNRSSLYATFGEKRALFLSTLAVYDAGRRQALAAFEVEHTPREAIRHVFLAFLRDVTEEGANRGCFLANTALELAAHDPDVRQVVATAQQDIEVYFARMIKKGKAAGEIPVHIKVTETARGLLASLLGTVVLIRSRPERALLEAIVDDAMRRLA